MKPALRLWVTIAALFCCAPAFAAPYPTADQLRKAIGEIAARVKSEQLEVEILDAREEGVTRPMMSSGLSLGDGVCIVYYNTKPEDGLIQFFDSMPAEDMPIWLNSVAMHEVTHCIEKREAYIRRRFDLVLPPGYSREHLTVQGYMSVAHAGALETWGEALADIASVLYFRQAVPKRWRELAGRLADMRSNLAGKWPEHDTSPWLRKIIAAGAETPANQSLFETAFQLRRQYGPDKVAPAVRPNVEPSTRNQ
jgi:hypothetical protein